MLNEGDTPLFRHAFRPFLSESCMPQPGIGHALQARWGSAFTTVSNVWFLFPFFLTLCLWVLYNRFEVALTSASSLINPSVSHQAHIHILSRFAKQMHLFFQSRISARFFSLHSLQCMAEELCTRSLMLSFAGQIWPFFLRKRFTMGFVTFDCVISADSADAIAQGALLSRTAIELCAEPYPYHTQC